MANEERIISSYKRKILKFYYAAMQERMSYKTAISEVEKLCSKVEYSEVLEFKKEAIFRLEKLDNE